MKRIISTLLIVAFLIGLIPAIAIPAFAATSGTTGGCTWSLEGDVLTISGTGEMSDFLWNEPSWGKNIKKLIIEPGVKSIGYAAFKGCSKLERVVIGEGVAAISTDAFEGCTSLTSIVIPDSVTEMEISCLKGCTNLNEITIPFVGAHLNGTENTHFGYIFGAEFSSRNKFYVPASLKTITITQANEIPSSAFEECSNITTVNIGDAIKVIGNNAFYQCKKLESINLGGGVTEIKGNAFKGCENLTSIDIPNSVTKIGDSAFSLCSRLSSVDIKNGIVSIGGSTFSNCVELESIVIPNTVESIGNGAFYNCQSLSSVVIGTSITTLNHMLFENCVSLTKLVIPKNVKTIESYTFSGCSGLSGIVVSDSVNTIGDYAFNNCDNLENIWYVGTQIQASRIEIGTEENNNLIDAMWHYESCPIDGEHKYLNACDAYCDYCSAFRVVGNHIYTNSCDSVCDECGDRRNVDEHSYYANYIANESEHWFECSICKDKKEIGAHIYSNNCDDSCNICERKRVVGAHNYSDACDGSCNECGATRTPAAHKGGTATCKAKAVCAVCGVSYGSLAGHKFGEYVYNEDATSQKDGTKTRTCSVCKKTETVTATGTKLVNPFKDVNLKEYYAEPVLWAVGKKITNGMSADSFAPNNECTRGQIVTFLWRAAGSPEPTSTKNPFKDVKSNQYYYKAVLWAVEKGITNGTSANTFSPDATCTRAQVVTFLWRAKGSPKVSASNPFKDVKKSYYSDAVLWAVKNNITTGTSANTFSPDATCTRGQIVTFLYRAYK